MQRPKVIFLDAVGTLFGVKGGVGKVYSEIAEQFGVVVSANTLDQAFLQSFKAAPPPIFPDTELAEIPQCEFEWWQNVAQCTFEQAGVLDDFPNFSAFFAALYCYFATAEPWFVYSDVIPTLQNWQQLGIQLGVLSNFDSRLYRVLQALELTQFFTSVTISTQVGVAKPDPKIFAVALAKHDCPADLAWHIGDSFTQDYQGAKAAGLRAIWLKRSEN